MTYHHKLPHPRLGAALVLVADSQSECDLAYERGYDT